MSRQKFRLSAIIQIICAVLLGLALVTSGALMRAAIFDKPSLEAQQILAASKRLAGW